MDGRPTTVDHRGQTYIAREIEAALRDVAWVAEVSARIREHGQLLVEVVPRDGVAQVEQLEKLQHRAMAVDWQLHAVPVRRA